jgi:tRNA pseudouridine55 synthase
METPHSVPETVLSDKPKRRKVGILLINKPPHITSHDAVQRVRNRLRTRRVGHSGTLDPIGTGLLVMGVGIATRFLKYLQLEPKVYVGEITLGVTTDTHDAEGTVIAQRDITGITLQKIRETAQKFVGEIEQIPPMYSAVKIQGERLYHKARRGEEVPRPPKRIHIYEFEISDYTPPVAHFLLKCGGGTYVRTLAHDLGEALGVGAHLSALTRTQMGRFTLENACFPDDVEDHHLIPLEEALSPMPMVELNPAQTSAVLHGQPIRMPLYPEAPYLGLKDHHGHFLAVARNAKGGLWQPECVIPQWNS